MCRRRNYLLFVRLGLLSEQRDTTAVFNLNLEFLNKFKKMYIFVFSLKNEANSLLYCDEFKVKNGV